MLEVQILEEYAPAGLSSKVHPFAPPLQRSRTNNNSADYDSTTIGSFRQQHVVEHPSVEGATISEEIQLLDSTVTITKAGILGKAYTPETWGEDAIAVLRTRFYLDQLKTQKGGSLFGAVQRQKHRFPNSAQQIISWTMKRSAALSWRLSQYTQPGYDFFSTMVDLSLCI